MTKRAVLYARVSGDDTRKEGRNLASQLDMGREHAQHKGYEIVAELAEDEHGASGADFDLPKLTEALELARAGRYDVLVVREIDRFARSLAKQLIVEEQLKRANVEIDYVLGEYPDTAEGALMKNVKASVAEYERLKINERMVRGRRNKAKAGHVVLHGHTPYGYTRTESDGGKVSLAVDETEARIVRLVYGLYLDDDLSAYATAKRLTELGIPTPTGRSRRWQSTSVGQLLEDEVYAGTWYYGKGVHYENPQETWIAVDVPAIVDRARWQRAQEKRAEMGKSYGHGGNLKHEYLLRRRVYCAACGSPMGCAKRRDNKYYVCPVGTKRSIQVGRTCDVNKHFWADVLDALVWAKVKEWMTEPDKLRLQLTEMQADRDQENAPMRERLGIVGDLLTDNRAKLGRLLDLYLDGGFGREMLATRRAELDKIVADLERERETLAEALETLSLTDGEIQTIIDLAARLAPHLEVADEDFDARRRMVKMLDVGARLYVEDGEQVARVTCRLLRKDETVSIVRDNTRTRSGESKSRRYCTRHSARQDSAATAPPIRARTRCGC